MITWWTDMNMHTTGPKEVTPWQGGYSVSSALLADFVCYLICFCDHLATSDHWFHFRGKETEAHIEWSDLLKWLSKDLSRGPVEYKSQCHIMCSILTVTVTARANPATATGHWTQSSVPVGHSQRLCASPTTETGTNSAPQMAKQISTYQKQVLKI